MYARAHSSLNAARNKVKSPFNPLPLPPLRHHLLPRATMSGRQQKESSYTQSSISCRTTYLQERFTSLPDLLARLLVHILFTNMRAPLRNDFLVDKVCLVQCHQNLGNASS